MSTDTAIRLAALAQVIALLACGAGWQMAHRDHIPRQAWLVSWGFGYVVGLVAVAITLNAALAEAVNAGMRAFTVLLVPTTAWVVGLTAREARRQTRTARDVLAWINSLDDLDPCANPDCTRKRDEARRIVARQAGQRDSR